MSSGIQANEHLDMQTNMDTCTSQCTIACSYACMQLSTAANMHDIAVKKCPLGLSSPQINIISIIKDARLPLSYQHISDILANTFKMSKSADAIRGYINRLRRNGFTQSKYATLGHRRGNIYTIMPLACSHIPMNDMQTDIQTNMYPAMQSESSILKEKIDSNLSILNEAKMHLESLSEDDIKFHWANLSRQGFGTNQIRQLITRLKQVNISLENVMQGLTHAEWDLEHEQMKDKHGNMITSPTNWVFKILAKQGYYPRPSNYISSQEQAERDAKIEVDTIKKVKKEFEDSKYQRWINSLSEEKKLEIMEAKRKNKFHKFPVPENVILHDCYMDYLKSDLPYRL